jgi:hypothetical protein
MCEGVARHERLIKTDRVEAMSTRKSEAIPNQFKDVTASWLSAVIGSNLEGVEVVSCELVPMAQTKHNKVRATVQYNSAGNEQGLSRSVVVKGSFHAENPYNTPGRPDVPLAWGNRAETLSYLDVLPLLPVEHPRCLAGHWDEVSKSSYIVMEDLGLRGTRHLDTFDTLSYGEAARFIDEMARMHATYWDSTRFDDPQGKFAELLQRSHDLKGMFEAGFVKLGAADHKEQDHLGGGSLVSHDHLLPSLYRDGGRQLEALRKFFVINDSFSRCIVMGDEHLRNMYISGAGRPGFVDWACRIEGWPQSLGTFMVNVLDPIDRRKWERPLLSHYLSRLSAHGAKAPNFEDAWFGYRCGAVFPLLVWANNRGAWQPETTKAGCTVRSVIAAMDLDTFAAIGV